MAEKRKTDVVQPISSRKDRSELYSSRLQFLDRCRWRRSSEWQGEWLWRSETKRWTTTKKELHRPGSDSDDQGRIKMTWRRFRRPGKGLSDLEALPLMRPKEAGSEGAAGRLGKHSGTVRRRSRRHYSGWIERLESPTSSAVQYGGIWFAEESKRRSWEFEATEVTVIDEETERRDLEQWLTSLSTVNRV